MTDDELDLIASAYVDGEATPEEVALVERDPDLAARVELFRQVQVNEPTIPPSGLADHQLAAAVAEFETIMAVGSPTETVDAREAAVSQQAAPNSVIDLRERAARRAEQESSGQGRSPARSTTRAFPSWLGAAAAVVVIAGGAVWAVGRAGSGQNDEAALEASAGDDTSADDAADTSEAALETADADVDAASAAESIQAEAMEDDAMEESAEEADLASDDDADDSADDGGGRSDQGEAGTGSFGLPPAIVFSEVPDPDTITDLPDLELDLDLSSCSVEVAAPALGEPLGFLPAEVAGQPAELFVFVDGDGAEVRLLVDGDCQPLEP